MFNVRGAIIALSISLVFAAVTPGFALDKCKATIKGSDGTIQVSASNVQGSLQWGDSAGQGTNSFFNVGSCVAGGAAKKCVFGDVGTLARITPPPGCTVFLSDGVGPTCSAYIQKCTPGARTTNASGGYTPTWTSVKGFTAAPGFLSAHYSRVGDLVTVVAAFDFPVFALGDNIADITVPSGLPVAENGGRTVIAGVFSSDLYRNEEGLSLVGAVSQESTTTVRLQLNGSTASGGASAYCTFTYETSAP
jgi:hypothetical protein